MGRTIAIAGAAFVTIGAVTGLALTGSGGGGRAAAGSEDGSGAAGAPGPIDTAEQVLTATATAYREARTLRDTMHLELSMAGFPPETMEVAYTLGPGTDGRISTQGLTATAIAKNVYLTSDRSEEKYFQAPLAGSLGETVRRLLGDRTILPVAFPLRTGRDVPAYVAALGMGVLRGIELSGHEMTTGEQGGRVHEIAFTAEQGKGRVRIDARTHFVGVLEFEATFPGDRTLTAKAKFAPRIGGEGEAPLDFDAADRRQVGHIQDLKQVGVGDVAPNFTLRSLGGEPVTLSRLKGSVVVLDFWATWCMPCRRGLPLLQRFDAWARTSGKPIVVYAIDTLEQPQPGVDVSATAAKFWKSQNFTMNCLLDADAGIIRTYGYQGIPATVIVGPDGHVAGVHSGFDPNMTEKLKRETLKILGE